MGIRGDDVELLKISDIQAKYRDCEKNIWKRHVGLLRRIALYDNNEVFSYDNFINLIYGVKKPNTPQEELIVKLLPFVKDENRNSSTFIKRGSDIFSVLCKDLAGEETINLLTDADRIIQRSQNLRDLANFMLLTHKTYCKAGFPNLYFGVFIMLNTYLFDKAISNLSIIYKDISDLKKLEDGNDEEKIIGYINFLTTVFNRDKGLPLSYLANVYEFSTDELMEYFQKQMPFLYQTTAKAIYLYGSFAKRLQRKDSDIDLAIVFKEDITYEEKVNLALKLKEQVFKEFKRFVDILEVYDEKDLSTQIGQNIKLI